MPAAILFLIMFLCLPGFLFGQPFDDPPDYRQARERMVRDQIESRGVEDPRVLSAMTAVPRHWFVPRKLHHQAYADHPLPIGEGQTISQPYIVALMTGELDFKGDEKVLEIGTGSGYQAAVLAKVAAEVYSIEIKEKLHRKATATLASSGFDNVLTLRADGYFGWPAKAPFDCIMITAAVDHIPPPLLGQLKNGGKLILPLGNPFRYQNLVLVTRQGDDFEVRNITGVLFVPMTGHALQSGG